MPLLPKCRRKPANGCHESYDSRLNFVCVRCVALHLRDYQLRIKFRKNGQRGQSPCGPTQDSGDSPHVGSGDSPHVVIRARMRGLDANCTSSRKSASSVPSLRAVRQPSYVSASESPNVGSSGSIFGRSACRTRKATRAPQRSASFTSSNVISSMRNIIPHRRLSAKIPDAR